MDCDRFNPVCNEFESSISLKTLTAIMTRLSIDSVYHNSRALFIDPSLLSRSINKPKPCNKSLSLLLRIYKVGVGRHLTRLLILLPLLSYPSNPLFLSLTHLHQHILVSYDADIPNNRPIQVRTSLHNPPWLQLSDTRQQKYHNKRNNPAKTNNSVTYISTTN
jgi:hypothetical protein